MFFFLLGKERFFLMFRKVVLALLVPKLHSTKLTIEPILVSTKTLCQGVELNVVCQITGLNKLSLNVPLGSTNFISIF